ncbi:uncharacterized protein [Physcomitrium patens]|uniref:t-SNARE coiled-coil homology domain-containing protein n=1 Tax=Physcomitrium patens TaxID=3218 RepID=A0A2K1J2R3_PHYPA|nr:uncharacterized protein LOC112294032 [Physcomitrium patens]PNR35813.1 hypothetical protein PHYPA_021663 [Physcomitrium patens]|eukprot:XP_024399892.1 uncharacterized protein LOC112294032 [Physcomitrella patens]
MGLSKAEVNLKRLLRAQVNQANEAKLVHYVATMRTLLAELIGDPARQELATIPASRAREYAEQIELVAQKIRDCKFADNDRDQAVAQVQAQVVDGESIWKGSMETLRDQLRDFVHLPQIDEAIRDSDASQGPEMSVSGMRRRLRGDELGNLGARESSRPPARVDASLQSLMQRHRELQEGLTDEMVMLSAQLKESSLMMDQALHETDKVLESTEDAVEYSLASTNRANVRMGALSSQSWKTSCLTWLILFVVFGMFMFMVVLIRVT